VEGVCGEVLLADARARDHGTGTAGERQNIKRERLLLQKGHYSFHKLQLLCDHVIDSLQ